MPTARSDLAIPRPKGSPCYGSSSHKILMMSKFYGIDTDIGILELRELNPNFRFLANIRRELFRLELAGYIVFVDDEKTRWHVTPNGVLYLYDLAKDNCKKVINSADGI